MSSSLVLLVFTATLAWAAPLILAAYGGLFSERSGVVNIGIEGMMTIGAFAGASVAYFTNSIELGFLAALLAGGIAGLLHAFLCVTLKVDQVISGVAINTIALALSLFLTKILFNGAAETSSIMARPVTFISGKLTLVTIIILLSVFLVNFVLYKTVWGTRVLAVGENPQAADAMGINVLKTRYQAVILSGILSGLAGMTIVINVTSRFTGTTVAGLGFIAIAVLIFGRHKPFGILIAGLIFGFSKNISTVIVAINPTIPTLIFDILPYIVTIIVLIIFSRNKIIEMEALGQPYDKEMR